jgi:RNA polymerase sigma factor (sigma-70 family)
MPPLSQASDHALLAAAAAGDRESFAVFYRRHLAPVVALLATLCGDRELAADLAAEVFATALLGAGRYQPQRPTALPWLCGIAKNKLSESRRRGRAEDRARRRAGMSPEPIFDADLERVTELSLEGTPLLEALDLLPPEQREAVWARVVEDRGYDEIALATHTSEATARQRVSRALARLRALAPRED